jgi:MFS family permease
MASITHSYYLPFYFQAVKGNSAAQSGLHGLPYGITATIGTIVGGAIMTFSGYYVPLMYIGSMILTTGCALLFTLSIGSNVSAWLGYQLVAGIGLGLSTQVPFIAVQVVVASDDMPTACALISFFRCFGGAVGISIAQNIFSSSLRNQLRQIPGVDANSLITAGAGNLSGSVTPTLLEAVREAYCYAVTRAYILPIAVAAVSVLCSFRMEWKIIKDDRNPKGGTQGSASGTPSGNLSGAKTGIPVQLPVEAAEVAHIRETSDKSQ